MKKHDYWLDLWDKGDLAFQQDSINPWLKKYWPLLKISIGSHVLVPLCGKSLDLIWLANAGYNVIGVELSNIACESFFNENKIAFTVEQINGFTRYYSQNIQIYCGDFMLLHSTLLPPIAAIYDRAALIALSGEIREAYAQHLGDLMQENCHMLLVVYDSPDIIQGPPYPVSNSEVYRLYTGKFQIEELLRKQIEVSEHLYAKGYRENYDVVYHLKR